MKVRQGSGIVLGFVDKPDLADVFRKALSDPSDDIHFFACISLYRLGERTPLLNAIRHPSPLIRLQACENLIVRWKAPSGEIIAMLEELSGTSVAREHDESIEKHREALRELIDQGHIDSQLIDEHGEVHREWTVAELIEEARRLMAGG